VSERLLRRAKRIASGRHLPAGARERFTEEIHDHLERAAEEHREAGLDPRKAERQALRDFGDRKKARVDLDRAWRGQRVVLFPDAPGEHLASFLVYDLKVILFILGLVILLRWQVVAAYHIPTKSMEPTLHGDPANGDKILVNTLHYTFEDPERFEVVVFEREGQDQNLIKRIAGLPGEELDIREGDLWIDGEIARKPPAVQEELLVPVFVKNRDVLGEVEGDARSGLLAFIQTGDEWTEDGRRFTGNAGAEGYASLGYGRTIVDEYPGGSRRDNGAVVGDLSLRFKVRPEEKVHVVGAVLRECRDHFEVRIPVGAEGATVLLRNKEEVARAEDLRFELGGERRIRFENIDNRVRLVVDGEERLVYEVEEPSTEPGDTVPAAELGFRGGIATFRDVELYRDIHYYRKDSRIDLPTRIPEGEYFMLGDNSATSADSRNWGPIPRSQFIGRPLFVYYPLNRLKVVR